MANIKIYGVLVNDTTEGIVTRADQILDGNLGKTQETINKEIFDVIDKFKDPTITYDDIVTKESQNAVQSRAIFKFVDDATSHMPYVGDDGYVYVWDLELGEYKRTGTNLIGPAGETGGTVHLIFETTLLKVNNLGQMYPSSPLRVRVIKQYGETGLDPYKDGCVKWWFNGIEDENKPDGWIGWSESGDEEFGEIKGVESGTDMSDFSVPVNSDHVDTITFILYIDKAGTKAFDQQNIFVIRDPAIYKLDLTNENSMVPMSDENGNVDDAYFETSQAILYHGAEQIPFEDINYSVISHDGLEKAEISEEGIITVSGWKTEWSVVNIQVCAEYEGNKFYATYSISRVSGITIYRLQPSVTSVKKHKDGTFSVDKVFANVFKVEASNSGGMSTKVEYAAEGIRVVYTYNNKIVDPEKDIYILDNSEEGIIVHGDDLPDTLDGDVSEIDIYVIKATQDITNLNLFIDHETIPVVEDGDDGFMIFLSNESSTVNCLPDGTQVGSLFNTQAVLMKGIEDYSDKCDWDFNVEPQNGLSSSPTWNALVPGYLNVAGCIMNKNVDQVNIYITATYPPRVGRELTKAYTITKAKQGDVGESGFKSSVFVRTNKVPDRPKNGTNGGSYENPIPDHFATSGGEVLTHPDTGEKLKWTDGIPTNSQEAIWMSTRLFTTSGIEQQTEWSEPVQMTDTSTFNVEFTWFDPYIGDPDTNPDDWFDPVLDADVFKEHSMIYMATQQLSNGQPIMHESQDGSGNETSWTIVRILGESGETAYKSMVFTRQEDQPPTPVGGSLENPIPDPEQSGGVIWHDGLPGGNALHPIWASMKTFSSLKGLETEWSEPVVMKDIPNQFDVEYSTVYENPGTPDDSPDNWLDPSEMTVEMQTQVWWLAQRWCGIEYSEDGVTPGWSEWNIMKIRGENGKDGSKAIPRMRGYWDDHDGKSADIAYGEWILSGTSHKQANDSGEIIEVTEEFQDIVYAMEGERKECYKCLISHQKSDAYNPAQAKYNFDEKTQSQKSDDGYWMKAEKYTFLATELLNAEQVLAGIISANKEVILGDVTGHWKGTEGEGSDRVFTQVVTENGKIEFKYSTTGNVDTWKTLVDIGWDINNKYGVLRFYDPASGQVLYNLGPEGLSAQTLQSPYRDKRKSYWNGYSYKTDFYNCYGVIFEDEESKNIYSYDTGTVPTISLSDKSLVRSESVITFRGSWRTLLEDEEFKYTLLEEGTSILQMSLPFAVMKPIPDYDVIDYSPAEGDPSVGYPVNNPIYTFGGNTIGYLAIKYPDLMYKSIGFSWENGTPPSYGILTNPIRKWICRSERITSLMEFTIIGEGAFQADKEGDSFEIYYPSSEISPFSAVLATNEIEGSTTLGAKFVISLDEKRDGYGLINYLASITTTANPLDSYITIEQIGDDSPLLSSTVCTDVINESISIVSKTFKNFGGWDGGVQNTVLTRYGSNINSSFQLEKGIQVAFKNACKDVDPSYRNSIYIASNMLIYILTHNYDLTSDNIIGFIFPETQQFKIVSPEDYSSDYLELETGITISSNIEDLIISEDYYKLNDDNRLGNIRLIRVLRENKYNHRAYLMLGSLSSKIGTTSIDQGVSGIGNTYKVLIEKEAFEVEDEESGITRMDYRVTIKYEAIDMFTAYLEAGKYYMPDSYGNYVGRDPWDDDNLLLGTLENAILS